MNPDKNTNRYFEVYIPKVMKTITTDRSITSNAKQQLNSIMCLLTEELTKQVYWLTLLAGKKTMSTKQLSNAIRLSFPTILSTEVCRYGETVVTKFENRPKHGTRQEKTGLIMPPFVAEKFLRYTGLSITKTTPIFMVAVLEYLLRMIFTDVVKLYQRNRIAIRDLELTVRQNNELNKLFEKFRISFVGGGVVPYIHDILLNKKPRRVKTKDLPIELDKKHRFRPGTVALREIRKMQKISNTLILSKLPFERLIRKVMGDRKISKDVFIVLQYYIEQFIVDFLRDTNTIAVYGNRVKIVPNDILLVSRLRKYDPIDITLYVENDLNKPVQEENEYDTDD